jgi:probable phosphoglycerate mutase
MRVLFLRHGQTDWNAAHRIQGGVAEIDLNEAGVIQAENAADGLARAGLSFDRVYSSPFRRAMHTAEIVCSRVGGSPVPDGRIHEIHFGEYEGTPYLEGGYCDENIRAAFENPPAYVPRGGETFGQVLARVRDFLDNELKPLEGVCDNVLVVAHGGVLHAVVTTVLGLDVSRFWEGRQRNCCVHVVDLSDGRFTLVNRGLAPDSL